MKHIASTQEEYWLARWNQLRSSGEALIKSYKVKPNVAKKDPYLAKQADLAHTLLDKLLRFSNTLFEFFYQGYFGSSDRLNTTGLIDQNLRDQLEKIALADDFFSQDIHPTVHVFHELLKKTSTDMLRIQRAYQLRLTRTPAEFSMNTTLFTADLLAQDILKKINTVLPFDAQFAQTQVLTYPDSDVEVRMIPYADILFVGFAVSAFAIFESENSELSSDYLALAHEAGHLLYRFGLIPPQFRDPEKPAIGHVVQNDLRQKLFTKLEEPEKVGWIFPWLEEIFSDVLGCLLEGPVYLIGFQQLMQVEPPLEIHAHDSDHPIAFLRPFIQNQIMSAMPGVPNWVASAGDVLTADWKEDVIRIWPHCVQQMWLDPDAPKQVDTAIFNVEGKTLTGKEILNITNKAVELVIDQLITSWGSTVASVEWLADDMETTIATQDAAQISQALHANYCQRIEHRYLDKLAHTQKGGGKEETQSIEDSIMLDKLVEISYGNDFVDLILNGFWSDEGPKGGINPGGG